METFKEIIAIKKTGDAPHDRADAINAVKELMGSEKGHKYWTGRTKHLEPNTIRDMVKTARGWTKNSRALFNKLIKK